MTECFIGIDIGTGSSKGVIADSRGNVLASSAIEHTMSTPAPGFYEQDAEKVWWHDFVYLCRNLLKQINQLRYSVRAAGISTIAPCVLPVDKTGQPLRPGIMYGIDTRAAAEIIEIEKRIGKDQIFRKTGQDLSSQSCCPKIVWIKKHEPDIWKNTCKFLTASGYLVFKLTGRMTVDIYNAIGYAPLFNLKEKRWDKEYEEALFPLNLLPELLWSSEIAGTISKSAAAETGLPADIPVITGTADAASEAIGAGVTEPGDMMMMYGSSNFFILRTKELTPLKNFWASNFTDKGSSVLTGGMATVGSMFKWFTDTFPGRSLNEWEKLAATSSCGAGGITVLPYFAGERTPLNDPSAKGVFFGMHLGSKPGDIFRAMQESIGFGIRHNIEELERAGASSKRIIAIGGASSSRQMLQIISDVCNKTQFIPSVKYGSSYGNTFLAATGAGFFSNSSEIKNWIKFEDRVEPDSNCISVYEKPYSRYLELYELTKHLMQG